jgi:hypothetical protein
MTDLVNSDIMVILLILSKIQESLTELMILS